MCFPFTARQRLTNAAQTTKGNPGSSEGSGRDHLGTQCSWTGNTRPLPSRRSPASATLYLFPQHEFTSTTSRVPLPRTLSLLRPRFETSGLADASPRPASGPAESSGARGVEPGDFPAPPGAVDTKRARPHPVGPEATPRPTGSGPPGAPFPASRHRALLRPWHLHPAGPPQPLLGSGARGSAAADSPLAASQPLALCCPRSEGHDMSLREARPASRGGGACGPAGFAPNTVLHRAPSGRAASRPGRRQQRAEVTGSARLGATAGAREPAGALA